MASQETNHPENDLLNSARYGDAHSIRYLVDAYKDLSYTIAMGILSNHEDAEEVVQDAFMKAFASLDKFRRTSKFSTWLYRIVYNTAVTKRRARGSRTVDIHQELPLAATTGNEGWDQLKDTERKKYVHLALNRLPAEDRMVVILHYIGEKSIAEICEITGSGKSAIKMRLLRARKQLEASLGLLLNNETRSLL